MIKFFGIRHHGPGSARRLVQAFDELKPEMVLIQGPADASDLLPQLADPCMVPPVALFVYPLDEPWRSFFWPFASFSPEYQAACWAVRHGAALKLIDIPAGWIFGKDPETPDQTRLNSVRRDPLGALAQAEGYADGESFWRDVIEKDPFPGPVFATVAAAISSLREGAPPPTGEEATREAYMRLEIAEAATNCSGPIAVVCGAWYLPALAAKMPPAADRALLTIPAKKMESVFAWTPWFLDPLIIEGRYSARVPAPAWHAHLWDTPPEAVATTWLSRIAAALREDGHLVSTAALSEALRQCELRAELRGRPRPGFEELREAAIACLCQGKEQLWSNIASKLLRGDAVGAIPDHVPTVPLRENLKDLEEFL